MLAGGAALSQLLDRSNDTPCCWRLQHCMELWDIVAQAEDLQSRGVSEGDEESLVAAETATAVEPAASLAALEARLARVRGEGAVPGAVWLRARAALLACKGAEEHVNA